MGSAAMPGHYKLNRRNPECVAAGENALRALENAFSGISVKTILLSTMEMGDLSLFLLTQMPNGQMSVF